MTVNFAKFVLSCAVGAWVSSGLGVNLAQAQTLQPLDLKTGDWETTTVTQSAGTAGMIALPPGMLEKMPPEQRAAFEQRMKAMQGPRTTVSHHCTTKEDLAKALRPSNPRQNCSYTVKTSTRSKQELAVACESDKAKTNGTFQLEAIDSGNVKGAMQMTGGAKGAEGQPINMSFTFTSKWVGPTCSEGESKTRQ